MLLPLVGQYQVALRPVAVPAALMAMVAKPDSASAGATTVGPPILLSPNPWPKITTG